MIYQTIDGVPVRDTATEASDSSQDTGGVLHRAAEVPLADEVMVRRRRQVPAGEPLPITFRWIAKLPRSVQPLALLRQFPRIANMMAGMWPDPPSYHAYLHDLLTDRRGKRKGFPPEIVQELVALQGHYENLYPAMPDVYKDVDKRG